MLQEIIQAGSLNRRLKEVYLTYLIILHEIHSFSPPRSLVASFKVSPVIMLAVEMSKLIVVWILVRLEMIILRMLFQELISTEIIISKRYNLLAPGPKHKYRNLTLKINSLTCNFSE